MPVFTYFRRVLAAGMIMLALALVLLGACGAPSISTPTVTDEFIFGVIMVGAYNDHGWSEAHYGAGRYVESKLAKARMVFLDNLNPDKRPGTTLEEAVDDLVAQGARMIFITSDDFSVDTYLAARKYPAIIFIHTTGDHVLKGNAPSNIGNYMGRMEYGKLIAGCAAALATRTGRIGYVGPLINDETRRLANSAYLGARYCYEHYRGQDPAKLLFRVDWIGFWFYIPGVTSDPAKVTNTLLDEDYDVLLSGIDTTEVLVTVGKRAEAGGNVWAIPYDYEGACDVSPQVCLGVPYFNWGPGYLKLVKQAMDSAWTPRWEWVGPDWANINNRDSSAVGFLKGTAMTQEQSAQLDEFIAGLADNSFVLFAGPLNFQDGSLYLAEGQAATDDQIWYMPQLLEGMVGLSD